MRSTRRTLLKGFLVAAAPLALGRPAAAAPQRANRPVPVNARKAGFALALGSGSHHGHALIGALRAFERRGFRPDLVVGTSVGAMVGALWASGMDADAIEKAAERFTMWRNAQFTWPTRGLFSNRGLQESMRELTKGRPIESWPMRFAAVATDLATGERVVIDRGDAAVAVAASASMPVLCRPVAWGNRLLVDGAFTEPVPVKAARDLGAQRVVGIDIAYRPANAPVTSVPGSGFQAMHILVNALIAEQARHADHLVRLDLHPLMGGRKEFRGILMKAGDEAIERAWAEVAAA